MMAMGRIRQTLVASCLYKTPIGLLDVVGPLHQRHPVLFVQLTHSRIAVACILEPSVRFDSVLTQRRDLLVGDE